MDSNRLEEVLMRNVESLSLSSEQERRMLPRGTGRYPSVKTLKEIMGLIKALIFPSFFDSRYTNRHLRAFSIGVNLEKLFSSLSTEIRRALRFDCNIENPDCPECFKNISNSAEELTLKFIERISEIKRLLYTDAEAMYDNDPAAGSYAEVIMSYPVMQAMIHYRTAHVLKELGVPVLPRVISELAHSATGIDIHPGATIGEYFAIDHGTGVVIGETSIIGNHVTIYQGVTLGAKNFTLDDDGRPVDVPRHPILEDNVTVYSNASILGRSLTHSSEPTTPLN
ncbi:MAG: serine acetyltransferase, partial [Muribaculaceae bacterium]|nr:serine acetyltransferase [Muribaculaceae bacterium]